MTPDPWLSEWKQQWTTNQEEATANSLMDSGWSRYVADRCNDRANALLRELVVRLSVQPTLPSDLFDRPQLAELIEAAKFAYPRNQT